MKIKTVYTLLLICSWGLVFEACQKSRQIIPAVANAAYVRIFTDFDISTDGFDYSNVTYKYFYLNGVFDSSDAIPLNAIRTSDVDIYNRPALLDYSTELYVYYNDSYYSFGSIDIGGTTDNSGAALPYYNYYPDVHNHVQVAPVIAGYDFYKWAQVSAGALRITVSQNAVSPGSHPAGSLLTALVDRTVQITKGNLYTYVLTKGPGNIQDTLLPMPENPTQASFNPDESYVRMVNVSPNISHIPADLDVYLLVRRADAPVVSISLQYSNRDTLIDDQYIGTVSGSFNTGAAFLPLPVLADSAFYKNGVLRNGDELPGYIFKFYAKGDGPSSGRLPLFVMNTLYGPSPFERGDFGPFQYGTEDSLNTVAVIKYPYTFDAVGGIHPTISTIIFGIRPMPAGQPGYALGLTRYQWEPSSSSAGYRK